MKGGERILAAGLALILGLAAAPPAGLEGDLLRGLVIAGLGALALAQGWLGSGRQRLGWAALLFGPALAVGALQLLSWSPALLDSLDPTLAGLYRA
ncbi:MAG: hypothetical protein JKY65_15250, partial [Planctomycetes bacterium]|nr:hypothetical protein [Planctomycetota bacterium]